jgi:DNA-binding NarL/FixJ family response regulator
LGAPIADFCTAARSVLDHDVTAQICRLWRRSKLSRKGSETLRLSELRPEVVLVDVMLGGESGFELARRLAAHHRDGGPTVILISTYSAADFAGPIAESPAAGFLPKQEVSADAIRRIVDGRGPAGSPGAPTR